MRRLPALLALALLAWLATAAPAGAGGWAVTTLDAVPELRSGKEATLGFVIRQHGITPVALDGVTLELRGPSGQVEVVTAEPEGPTGHYVARVRPSEDGAWALTVYQSWFGPQELGVLPVGPAAAIASGRAGPTAAAGEPGPTTAAGRWLTAATGRWLTVARYGLPALAAGLVLVAVSDIRAARVRRHGPSPTREGTSPAGT